MQFYHWWFCGSNPFFQNYYENYIYLCVYTAIKSMLRNTINRSLSWLMLWLYCFVTVKADSLRLVQVAVIFSAITFLWLTLAHLEFNLLSLAYFLKCSFSHFLRVWLNDVSFISWLPFVNMKFSEKINLNTKAFERWWDSNPILWLKAWLW